MDVNHAPVATAALASSPTTAGHAAVQVLGSRDLWDLLMGFMSGYPQDVTIFLRGCTSAMQSLTKKSRLHPHLLASLTGRGLLPNLAVAANAYTMLKVLRKLSKKPQYLHDRKLSFARAHHCAVAFNRVEILKHLRRMRGPGGSEPRRQWEPWLMNLALDCDDPDLRVLDQLTLRLPQGSYSFLEAELLRHTRRGALDVVRWLREHGCEIYQSAVDAAADTRNLELLRYFYEHSDKRCMFTTAANAARRGDLDILKLIVENPTRDSVYERAVIDAIQHGQLEVVTYFIESKILFGAVDLIDCAAQSGHLHVVQYLHENYTHSCTASAMSVAAANGHLEIVKFLHYNRTESWSKEVIHFAATGGHVEVVKFLYLNYAHVWRPAESLLGSGARSFEIVEFLCEQQQEEFKSDTVRSALLRAVSAGDLRTIALLHGKLHPGESVYPVLQEALERRQPEIVKFLCENQTLEQQPLSLLMQAVANANAEIVRAASQYASVAELRLAKEFALEQNQFRIADILAQCIVHTMTQRALCDDQSGRDTPNPPHTYWQPQSARRRASGRVDHLKLVSKRK